MVKWFRFLDWSFFPHAEVQTGQNDTESSVKNLDMGGNLLKIQQDITTGLIDSLQQGKNYTLPP